MSPTSNQYIEQLRALGIKNGDTVLVKLSTKAFNAGIPKDRWVTVNDILENLLDAVGPDGTIVSMAFNPILRGTRPNPNQPYTQKTPPYTGLLPTFMVNDPRSVRSEHPLESFVAIGGRASEMMAGHTADTHAMFPVSTMLAAGGKMLNIGTGSNSGFNTVHLVQHELGLTKRVLNPGSDKTYYLDGDGKIQLYVSREIPGCSLGFDKFYKEYIRANALIIGHFGNAYSLSMSMSEAVKVEYDVLSKDCRFFCCDDPDCWFCYSRYLPNWYHFPKTHIKKWLGIKR